ncbi:MAG TPA: DUF4388 domain-containing protein [Myxococcales bacterium]|jgi:hypothetical protein|nr:DUF4388 domain-containing protein [Myxococcales bacterium]
MSLSGNLEDVSVADAMQFIHLGARTGTLTLKSGETSAEIGFHQGKIVNAVGPGTKRLGDLLIENNVIDQGALDHALREQEAQVPRRSLGQVLLAMNVLTPETMYRAIEQQIERTVYDLVTWTHGTFHFALDDLKPIDDIALVPGDVIRHLNLDTQMVLLDALRIFDERNRDAALTPAGGVPPVAKPAAPAPAAAAPKTPPAPPVGVIPLLLEVNAEKVRLQVVSSDRQIAERLAQEVPDVTVVRVNLRDAGTPPPGEGPPVVLLDLRQGAVALDAISGLRRARPRATILALIDGGVPVAQVYEAGAIAAVQGDMALLGACFRSVAQNRRDLMTGGSRADRINANFAKLRRIVGDLRSGLISTTISLSLMNIISESVERAVLFLVRRDGLVALGAFGNSPGGQPLAQLSRGLKVALGSRNALTDSLADGQVRAVAFDDARFPENFSALLGRPRTGQCAIFPVMGGQRVIALVYADNGHSNRVIEELDILELAASQAGLAFENELLRRQATQPQ